MADPISIQELGNQLMINMSDGSKLVGLPTGGTLWVVKSVPDVPPVDNSIYNPWADWYHGGTWFDHASYSAGGQDYGGSAWYGDELLAPAAGNLRTSGGSGEFQAGSVGSAGNRSVLELDVAYPRIQPAENPPQEYDGPMVAIVIQHQSAFAPEGHKAKGEVIGYVGNSGGADTHVHVHGLNAAGQRVDFLKFIP